MKKIFIFFTVLFAVITFTFAQNRNIARGAKPGELYLAGHWYGIGSPMFCDTLRHALYHIIENGKKLTIQYDADGFAHLDSVMQSLSILADATLGVVYNNSHTSLWVSFDYGKKWILREKNIGNNRYYTANVEGIIYRGGGG